MRYSTLWQMLEHFLALEIVSSVALFGFAVALLEWHHYVGAIFLFSVGCIFLALRVLFWCFRINVATGRYIVVLVVYLVAAWVQQYLMGIVNEQLSERYNGETIRIWATIQKPRHLSPATPITQTPGESKSPAATPEEAARTREDDADTPSMPSTVPFGPPEMPVNGVLALSNEEKEADALKILTNRELLVKVVEVQENMRTYDHSWDWGAGPEAPDTPDVGIVANSPEGQKAYKEYWERMHAWEKYKADQTERYRRRYRTEHPYDLLVLQEVVSRVPEVAENAPCAQVLNATHGRGGLIACADYLDAVIPELRDK